MNEINKSQITKGQIRVVVYGGNGFVGTHLAKQLAEREVDVVCLSRTGVKPVHLQDQAWSEKVKWCKGDASQPNTKFLESVDSIVCLVGSPPLPTFSKAAWEAQFFQNGTTNSHALDAAASAGVKRAVLLGAKVTFPLNTDRFAYFQGKRLAREAAKRFADHSEQQSAVVVEPGVIFGKRHLRSGSSVPLHLLSPLSGLIPGFLMDVNRLASRLADEALNFEPRQDFQRISNSDI